ncbi:protein of unknown function [Algoriphagus alkaliphilus]|uniref:DUF4268 domain-containing protein n=1 Tax=Algoriphagus alkaliphilus TaxID=279824 RepID=A0A1G5ZIZ8_9BACT|nr:MULTISPECIES: DUF4268 domain-containing protein [Algoriphagus]MDO8966846.1 DUF4268 domain-containing protein [Algoriphagus sp.]MDP3199831.1 DUF4268 domain-containing protein [Algoriphagus sp.]SDA94542.1 protein of unknown function [Algoriphagus alkaliphilus]
MYSRSESSRIRAEFWITFGQYMKPVPNAQGRRINWPNYRTGVKDVYFRMKAEQEFASIGIELGHKDEELQELYFEQFKELKSLLKTSIGEDWEWKLHSKNEVGQVVSKIEKVITGVNVMEEYYWPEIISFLKPRIIALDEFWDNVKPAFEN